MAWWRDNLTSTCNAVDESHGVPDLVIESDASLTAWGYSRVEGRDVSTEQG